MASIPLKELPCNAPVPFQRLFRKIKPGEQAHTQQHMHTTPVSGPQHRLNGVRAASGILPG